LEIAAMIRIGYAPGAYDLFHIGHLNLLRQAKERCDFLIAGVAADQVLIEHKKVTPITFVIAACAISTNPMLRTISSRSGRDDKRL
jgi:glycerol-3-phosphate cytidylyltransferase